MSIYQNSIIKFVVTVNKNDEPHDISNATEKKIVIRKPDQSLIISDVNFFTDGTDGKLYYVTGDTDLAQSGLYACQIYLEFPGSHIYSSLDDFKVYESLTEI